MTARRASYWHWATAVVAIAAVLLQVWLIVIAHVAIPEDAGVDRLTRFGRLISYFTIQTNLLVAGSTVMLARDPYRDGRWFRPIRVAAVVGITVVAVVHYFLLGDLHDLEGIDWVGDKLLHMVVPALAILGWAVFGPRPRIDGRAIGLAICWPLAWLGWSLAMGAATGWYPYPFLDHREPDGTSGVVITSVAITVFFLALFGLALLVDRRARPAPREDAAVTSPTSG